MNRWSTKRHVWDAAYLHGLKTIPCAQGNLLQWAWQAFVLTCHARCCTHCETSSAQAGGGVSPGGFCGGASALGGGADADDALPALAAANSVSSRFASLSRSRSAFMRRARASASSSPPLSLARNTA